MVTNEDERSAMKPVSLCIGAFILNLFAGPVTADRVILVEHGLWEYTHTLEIPGLLDPVAKPQTKCISPDEAQQNLSDLLGELSGEPGCQVSNLKDDLSSVTFDLACNPSLAGMTFQSNGRLAFRYGRTKITGTATGAISIGGVEMPVNASGVARRVGRCKD